MSIKGRKLSLMDVYGSVDNMEFVARRLFMWIDALNYNAENFKKDFNHIKSMILFLVEDIIDIHIKTGLKSNKYEFFIIDGIYEKTYKCKSVNVEKTLKTMKEISKTLSDMLDDILVYLDINMLKERIEVIEDYVVKLIIHEREMRAKLNIKDVDRNYVYDFRYI